jgi:hypothetical protein
VKVPFGHAVQVLATAVVFQGHALHETAPDEDIIPGGQLMQFCKS